MLNCIFPEYIEFLSSPGESLGTSSNDDEKGKFTAEVDVL